MKRSNEPLWAANDLLGGLETMLHTASIAERVAIAKATETIYGPDQGDHYQRLLDEITTLRASIYDHLDR